MPVRVVKEGASPGPQGPSHLKRVPIPLLTPTMDCADRAVKGRVLHKGPLVSLGDNDFLLKTVIEENAQQSSSSENTSINVILLGDLAKEFSESVSHGDVLVVSGFTVGKSPSAQRDHPCSLQLSGDDTWVYVFPSLTPDPRASASSKRTSPPSPPPSLASKRTSPPSPPPSLASKRTSPRSPPPSLASKRTSPPSSPPSLASKRTSPRSPPPSLASKRTSPRSHPPSIASKRTAPHSAAKVPKYSYVSLGELQPGVVVNVYGVVIFFKQPFQTRGTDYCSTFKIVDQSNEKVGCTIFSNKLENHPQIFKMGDIIRLHRVKTQLFNGSMTLLTSFGFSVMTFDGAVGSAVVPRTSSRSPHFSEADRWSVEALRSWAAEQLPLSPEASPALEALQPKEAYFNLTCQLLARAAMDSTCTLLKVWDGTKCPHPLLNVFVEPHLLEGRSTLSQDMENLAANVLVYDNHIEVAQQLKPGAYIRIYNIHAVPGTSKVPGNSTAKSDQLEFHLHGGTAYGRGIRVLPDDSPDVQKLKRLVESFSEPEESVPSNLNDMSMMEVWSTPPEDLDSTGSFETAPEERASDRTCNHVVEQVTLAQVKESGHRGVFHIQAQVQSYQPQRLYQSLKLFCHKCKSIQDVPDDETLGALFSEAQKDAGSCNEGWALEGRLDVSGGSAVGPHRTLTLLLPSRPQAEAQDLLFIKGASLDEICRISAGFRNVVPVTSSQGRMSLLDLSAPFLFWGTKRYYGCKQCSQVNLTDPSGEEAEVLDVKTVAEALGVQVLQYGVLVTLELRDESASLDALLWTDAETFFAVSPEEVADNQDAQDRIQKTMDKLCPPGSRIAERPWLDLCVRASEGEEHGQRAPRYQICQTNATVSAQRPTHTDPA